MMSWEQRAEVTSMEIKVNIGQPYLQRGVEVDEIEKEIFRNGKGH